MVERDGKRKAAIFEVKSIFDYPLECEFQLRTLRLTCMSTNHSSFTNGRVEKVLLGMYHRASARTWEEGVLKTDSTEGSHEQDRTK